MQILKVDKLFNVAASSHFDMCVSCHKPTIGAGRPKSVFLEYLNSNTKIDCGIAASPAAFSIYLAL